MNCASLADYIAEYGSLIADRARAAFEPLHVPSTDAVVQLDLKRDMLPAQAHVVTAMTKCLKRQKAVFCNAECGTGKTQIGICTVHAHAAGKPYRAIAMVPPHLLATWQSELTAVFHRGAVDLWVLESWDELFMLPRGKLRRPLWLLISETTAKMGPGWKPAATRDARGFLRCPTCGAEIRGKATGDGQGNLLTLSDLEKTKRRCQAELFNGCTGAVRGPNGKYTHGEPIPFTDADGKPIERICGAPLWTYDRKDRIWPPAHFIHKHMKGVFDYLIVDEAHQEKSDTSARAGAMGALIASCRKVIAMTGTLIGGKASHVRSLLFRMNAKSLVVEDLGWGDSMEFSRRYGRVDTIITEKESSGSDNRRSRGKTRTKREAEQPGILPQLFGRHLIGNTVFLSLADVAADLPSYEEIPTPVSMCGELATAYQEVEAKLKAAVKELLRKGNHQLLSPMLHCLLAYPDLPRGWPLIGYTDWKDGPHGRFVPVVAPPDLDKNTLWPKERELLRVLKQERAAGRQVWAFATYTDKHDVLGRMEAIAQQAGFRAKVLRADKVPTKSRSEWITKNAPGVDVMISHPQPVGTGLTLFQPNGAYNFPSLYFHEQGFDLFALRQASRRSWRIGQKEPCRVYFTYYASSMQERAMGLMAQKMAASMALEGEFSADGLAAMCAESGNMAMELAKSLAENIDFGNVERNWAKIQSPTPTPALFPTRALAE